LVGLGNLPLPNTRHNVGMMTIDHIAKALGLTWSQYRPWKADKAETSIRIETTLKSETIIKEYSVTLLKPRKLMNISGSCVAQAVKDLSIPMNNIYVFHDDMQRELGKVSLKASGSANGHNGIKSVIDHLKSDQFKRVRIGIGRPIDKDQVVDYVLGKFTHSEMETLDKTIYPMWTQQSIQVLCDKGEITKQQQQKIKNKHLKKSSENIVIEQTA
ncbi:peptidyl-tRNA hydrolase, partial [Backusella circina FSU 941]